MTTKKTSRRNNIILIICIIIFIIPQTRKPIQVALNKVLMFVRSPSALAKTDQEKITPFDYQLLTLDGIPQSISIAKGKPVFVSYWATWCPPCVAELASIEALYKDFGDRVDFILITNESSDVVRRFLTKKGYDLPVMLPAQETPSILYEQSIPTNYIIDSVGNIVVKEQGATNWNSDKVREIMEQLLVNDK